MMKKNIHAALCQISLAQIMLTMTYISSNNQDQQMILLTDEYGNIYVYILVHICLCFLF